VFFSLSYTFMTDNFFLASILASLLFYMNYIKRKKKIDLILAILFSIVSTISRQIGLFLPLSFGISILLSAKPYRKNLIPAFLPVFVTFLSYMVFYQYLKYSNNIPE